MPISPSSETKHTYIWYQDNFTYGAQGLLQRAGMLSARRLARPINARRKKTLEHDESRKMHIFHRTTSRDAKWMRTSILMQAIWHTFNTSQKESKKLLLLFSIMPCVWPEVVLSSSRKESRASNMSCAVFTQPPSQSCAFIMFTYQLCNPVYVLILQCTPTWQPVFVASLSCNLLHRVEH